MVYCWHCISRFLRKTEETALTPIQKDLYLNRISNRAFTGYKSAVFIRHGLLNRVIHKSLRDLRPLRYSSRDGHAEGEHVNRGRDTPSFYPTLQVLDMYTLGDAAYANPVIKFLPITLHVCSRNLITGLTSAASPRLDISSTCKVGQKLVSSLPLLTCSPSA